MKDYRPDIDGLRALAVLPVVFFHADLPHFTGGFVGVDIFFVISGYLITRVLLQDKAAGKYSLRHFYVRRVRRIFPALLVTVLATLVAGFFLLLPAELGEAARAAQYLSYFFSNHLFWQTQNDYWQQNMLSNQPLLHTWSLAVEEQFYVVIPALLALWFWTRQRPVAGFGLSIAIGLLALTSFAANLTVMQHDTAAAFYVLPTRAWELLLGSLLAARVVAGGGAIRHAVISQLAGTLGLGLILWSILVFTAQTAFPGVNALLPSVGALLIIWAGGSRHPSWVNRILSLRPLVWIGLISYSLYLWHWPVLVLVRSTGWHARGLVTPPMWLLLPVIVGLAWLSWRYIERPFRGRRLDNTREWKVLAWAVVALAACYALGLLAQRIAANNAAIKQPLPAAIIQLDAEIAKPPGTRCEGDPSLEHIRAGKVGCALGADADARHPPAFALLGDSHARMWVDGADQLARQSGLSGLAYVYSSCVPLADVEPPTRPECLRISQALIDRLAASDIPRIIIAGYWIDAAETIKVLQGSPQSSGHTLFYTGLDRTLQRLSRPGRQIYVVRDIPELTTDRMPYEKALESLRRNGQATYGLTLAQHRQRQAPVDADIDALQQKYGFVVLDPAQALCSEHGCMVADQGRTLYRDKHHMTDATSVRLRNILTPAITPGS